MNLPKSINVLGQKWAIKSNKHVLNPDDNQEVMGYADLRRKEIWISTQEPEMIPSTLIHELCHAALSRSSMHQCPRWDPALEEIAVDVIANTITENFSLQVKKKR